MWYMQAVNQADQKEAFLERIFRLSHSEYTKRTYKSGIERFHEFLNTSYNLDINGIVAAINEAKIDPYEMLDKYASYLDKYRRKTKTVGETSLSPKTIEIYMTVAKTYLRFFKVKIYSEDFKQTVVMPKKKRVQEMPLTKELIVRLLRNASPKLQTIILMLVSSGMRIGELFQLRLSDIDFASTPTRINVRAEISKNGIAREVYITSEATKALKDYLTKELGWMEGRSNDHLEDDSIFEYSSIFTAESSLHKTLTRILKSIPSINKRLENGRYAIHAHAFRKFFRTIVGDVLGRDYAEALCGHRFYMDTYYQQPIEKRRQMYMKVEPYLTISDFVTVEKNLEDLMNKNVELEKRVVYLESLIRSSYVPIQQS